MNGVNFQLSIFNSQLILESQCVLSLVSGSVDSVTGSFLSSVGSIAGSVSSSISSGVGSTLYSFTGST